jgi:hypothetical protein
VDKVCSKFLEVWKHFLERKEEDQRVQQVSQELCRIYFGSLWKEVG